MAGEPPNTSSGWLEVTELYGSQIPYLHKDFAVAVDGIVLSPGYVLERDRQGWRKRWPVTPGTHTLRLGRGWLKSPEVSFTVAAGQKARFLTRNRTVPESFLTRTPDDRLYQNGNQLPLINGFYLLCSVFKHDLWITILQV